MNDEGYTLIEVLGVIIIITSLSLLVIPNMVNKFIDKRDESNKINEEIIVSTAKLFVSDHEEQFLKKTGARYCLNMNNLIKENYLDSNNKDIKYNQKLAKNKIISIYYTDTWNYEIVDLDACDGIQK